MENLCAYCSRGLTQFLSCPYCSTPFCNADCQANDWGYHKKYCSAKKTIAENQIALKEAKRYTFTELHFAEFEIIKQIGEGNFTVIKKVEHIESGKIFALKLIDRVKVGKMHKEGDVLAEKHSLIKLSKSHYVVKIFGTFRESNMLYILQEYIPGHELWHYCQYFGLGSDLLTKYYMFHILTGIKSMHGMQVVHRDVKPENVLICNSGNSIKFVDLGSSKDLEKPEIRPKITPELKGRVYEHFAGTAQYMAPECANNKESEKPCDIWSAGCLWYHLYVGWAPFVGATDYLVFQKSLTGKLKYLDPVPAEARELIQSMIQLDPKARPTVEALLGNPIFDSVRELRHKPLLSLADTAMITLKEYYVKNSGVIKVRPENVAKAMKEVEIALANSEKSEAAKKKLGIFKLQLISLLTDAEFGAE